MKRKIMLRVIFKFLLLGALSGWNVPVELLLLVDDVVVGLVGDDVLLVHLVLLAELVILGSKLIGTRL